MKSVYLSKMKPGMTMLHGQVHKLIVCRVCYKYTIYIGLDSWYCSFCSTTMNDKYDYQCLL